MTLTVATLLLILISNALKTMGTIKEERHIWINKSTKSPLFRKQRNTPGVSSRNDNFSAARLKFPTNSLPNFRLRDPSHLHPNHKSAFQSKEVSLFKKQNTYLLDTNVISENSSTETFKKHIPTKRETESSHLIINTTTSKRKRFISEAKSMMSKMKHLINNGGWKLSSKEAAELFDAYYVCQEAKVKSLLEEEFPIQAHLAVEGEEVTLTCHVCYRPDQDAASQRPIWQFLSHEHSGLRKVIEDDDVKVTRDFSLVIKDIDVNDAGQYFCVERHDYAAVWQLDVFLQDKRRHVTEGVDKTQPELFLMERNLRVFTMWASWSECNTCDRQGHRSRIGQCTVKKIYSDFPIFPRDYPLMELYPSGVPCHSTALPRHIRRLGHIGGRESETLISSCMEECPTEPPAKLVTDETGKVLEVIKPGFYSLNDKPKLPKLVKRKVIYEAQNSHAVLNCPGDLETSLVRWVRGQRDVDPAVVKRQTAGRVWLDQLSRLHFNPLLLGDTAVYNCFEKSRRVASIKLMVVDEMGQEMKIYISYGGLVVTIIGAVGLFCCLCCKKNKSAQ